jgi:hypothetical protein
MNNEQWFRNLIRQVSNKTGIFERETPLAQLALATTRKE